MEQLGRQHRYQKKKQTKKTPEEKEPKAFVVCLIKPLRRKKKEMEIL